MTKNYRKIYEDYYNIKIPRECDGWYKYKLFLEGKYYDVFDFDLSKDNYDISKGFSMYGGRVKYDI